MSHQIYRIAIITIVIFGLFAGTTRTFASIPPHPRVANLIKENKIPNSYYLQNRKELLQRGVNAPWSSPEIQKQSLHKQSGIQRSLGPSRSPQGSWKALAILVKFSDKAQSVDSTSFDNLLFKDTVGTLRNYYKVVSYDNLDIVTVNLPSSLGWTMAPHSYSYYVNGQNGFGMYPQNAQKLVEDVIAAIAGSVDFSQYDNDHDGYVDALFIVHTGSGAEFTGSNSDIWSHSWTTNTPLLHNGVYVYRYSMEPEYWMIPGDMTCGVFDHELGHAAFGLPDLYDTDYSSEGLGNWSIMAGGSWNGALGLGDSPSFPDAWSQFQMGFLAPTNVTSPLLSQSIDNAENNSEAFRLWTNGNAGSEYYLVQNRQQVSYDTYLPGSGMLIYHIDDSVTTDNQDEWYPGHTSSGHYHVALEQADGLYELEKDMNKGNAGDPYPGWTVNKNFDSTTSPNSNSYAGTSTNVSVKNISNSASVMSADLQVGLIPGRFISVTPDTVKSGIAFIGIPHHDTVFVCNVGSDPLTVSSILSTSPAYTPGITSFSVPAGGTQPVALTFAPTDTVTYNGTLSITSNDTSHAVVQVVLTGRGAYAPVITVVPDSFAVALVQNDSTTRTLTIGNTGQGPLSWAIGSQASSPRPMSVMAAVQAMKRNAVQPLSGTRQIAALTSNRSVLNGNWTPEKAINTKASPFKTQGGIDIAIVHAEDSILVEDVRSKLLSTGQFNSVSLIDGGSITPTLAQLQAFKAVLVFSDYFWLDRTAMGNALAAYIEHGGGVVSGLFATAGASGSDPGGNFVQYELMSFGTVTYSTGSLGMVYLPSHPLMQGVTTFATGIYGLRPVNTTVSAGAVKVADWNDGKPLIVYKDNVGPMNAHRVDLGFFPVSDGIISGLWLSTADGAKIMANALLYVGGNTFLSVTPTSGSVAPDSTQDITVKFNAKDLQAGDYRSVIAITSNDPINSPKNVPASMHVIGRPVIATKPDTIKSGIAFIGIPHQDTVVVRNAGSEPLVVSSITSTSPVYTPGITSFTLAAGGVQPVALTFAPTDSIAYNGTLSIISNDTLRALVQVVLTGQGAYAPAITVAPDSFAVAVAQNDSTTRTLTIGNTGSGPLNWNSSFISPGRSISLFTKIEKNIYSKVKISPKSFIPQKEQKNADKHYPVQKNGIVVNANVMIHKLSQTEISESIPLFGIDQFGLSKINPVTGAKIHSAALSMNSGGPHGLCYDGSVLYFIDGFGINRLVRIDPNQLSIIDTIKVDFPAYIDGLATNGKSVFALDYNNSLVYEVDISSKTLIRTLNFNLKIGGGMSYAGNRHSFFIGSFNNKVYEIDALDGHIIDSLSTTITPYGIGYSCSGNVLFIGNYGSQTQILDPNTGEIISSFSGGYDGLASDECQSSFLTLIPSSGSVVPNSSQNVTVKFNAKGLQGGDYRSVVSITSNDPVNNPKNVPANMHVTGRPVIATTPDTVKSGVAFIGIPHQDTVVVRNAGSEPLVVSSITSTSPVYTPSITSFTLPAGGTQPVALTFVPTDSVAYNGTLSITSNDTARGAVQIVLTGRGAYAPAITIAPDSFAVALAEGDSTAKTMTISNTGQGELTFDIGNRSASLVAKQDANRQVVKPLKRQTANQLTPTLSAPHLAGNYSGTTLNFGISDYGEIMPFQFPVGVEHLQVGMYVSGYTVAFMVGSTDHVEWAGFADRNGITPVSYSEIQNDGTKAVVEARVHTSGNELEITRRFTFIKSDQYIRIETSIKNISGSIVSNIAFKEWTDWDDDGNTFNDWGYDSRRMMIYAHEIHFTTIVPLQPPSIMDIDGWNDYHVRLTDGDVPPDSISNYDGLELLHFDLGSLNSGSSISLANVYAAGNTLAELQSVVDRAGIRWISCNPTSGTVAPGASQNITVKFNAKGLQGGDYRSVISVTSNDPGNSVKSIPVRLTVDTTKTDVTENGSAIPKEFALHQNYPNPFNPSTTIQYALPARSIVKLQVFNMLGQLITELVGTEQNAGYQSVVWKANVASGLYFYRIEAIATADPSKRFVDVKKMLMLK